MLIEKVERPGRKSPQRTSRASSQMWGPQRIFSQRRAPQEVLRAPYLLDVEECHLERGSSSAVELWGKENLRKHEIIGWLIESTCLETLSDWQQVLWVYCHRPSFPPFQCLPHFSAGLDCSPLPHPHSLHVILSSTECEDPLATAHMVQTPHHPRTQQGLLLLKVFKLEMRNNGGF